MLLVPTLLKNIYSLFGLLPTMIQGTLFSVPVWIIHVSLLIWALKNIGIFYLKKIFLIELGGTCIIIFIMMNFKRLYLNVYKKLTLTTIIWKILYNFFFNRYTFRGHVDSVNDVHFKPYSNIFASGSADKTVSFWDIRSGLCV
jgi:WD40 repeat protein